LALDLLFFSHSFSRSRISASQSEESLLYQVVAGELETFLASQQDNERNVPGFVENHLRLRAFSLPLRCNAPKIPTRGTDLVGTRNLRSGQR
jgi:hypothetical protein